MELINYLFDQRLKYKNEGNSIQEVFKLLMNSCYGKTILKESPTNTVYFGDSEFEKKKFESFIHYNYNSIIEYTKLHGCEKYKVVVKKNINNHFNIPHVGCEILSMSKRIMNEVICLAQDNNISIYYQDTDSMHIEEKDIQILAEKFKEKYNKILIGKKLGQFHSDFSFDKHDNIYSNKSIFLGKKCYIDELRGTNKEGKEEIMYHMRMKGIPSTCITYTAKKLGLKNEYELYERLYNNEKIQFDLLEGNKKVMFKRNVDKSIETLRNFYDKNDEKKNKYAFMRELQF